MGAEFIAEEGVLKGLILSLESSEVWTIGRDPDLSDIAIEDPKASRVHLRVLKKEEGYFVENLSATNPILVGDAPVSTPMLLHEGDLLTIGGSIFRFYPAGAPAAYGFVSEKQYEEEGESEKREPEEEPVEKLHEEEEPAEELHEAAEERPQVEDKKFDEEVFEEGELSLERAPAEEVFGEALFDESKVPQLDIDLTQTTRFILKVIAGPNTGAEFALDLDGTYLSGTDTVSCDIIFNDLSVSREHARLHVSKEGIITIQDLGSRNGV